MADLNHFIGDDLVLSNTGDLALADGMLAGQQRLLRRLLTAVRDYIWHQEYGAGLPAEIGTLYDEPRLLGLVRSQLYKEPIVSTDPRYPPAITFTRIPTGAHISVRYTDSITRQVAALNFTVDE